MGRQDLDGLICSYFAGSMSTDDEGVLWQMLRADNEASDRFVEFCELESALVAALPSSALSPAGQTPTAVEPAQPDAPRSRSRLFAVIAAAASIVVVLGLLATFRSGKTPLPGTVRLPRGALLATAVEVKGKVLVTSKGQTTALQPGHMVGPGDRVITRKRAATRLLYADRTTLSLGENARLQLAARSKAKNLRIFAGHLRAIVTSQPPGCPMLVRTNQGRVRVLGTTLRVAAGPGATLVETIRGRVNVALSATDTPTSVRAGQYLLLRSTDTTKPAPKRRETNMRHVLKIVLAGSLLATTASPASERVQMAVRNLKWADQTCIKVEKDMAALAGKKNVKVSQPVSAAAKRARGTSAALQKKLAGAEPPLGHAMRLARQVGSASQMILERAEHIAAMHTALKKATDKNPALLKTAAPAAFEKSRLAMISALSKLVAHLLDGKRIEAARARGEVQVQTFLCRHAVEGLWGEAEVLNARKEAAAMGVDLKKFDALHASLRAAKARGAQREVKHMRLEHERHVLELRGEMMEREGEQIEGEVDRARGKIEELLERAEGDQDDDHDEENDADREEQEGEGAAKNTRPKPAPKKGEVF